MALSRINRDERSLSDNQDSFRMRPIELSDSDVVATWYQQLDDVSIYDRQTPLPLNHTDVASLIVSLIRDQEDKKCRWFITENTDGVPVGMAGLENINLLHGHAIMPVFIAEPWRRSGIGIRMACMIIDLAFKQLRLNRVSTVYRVDNIASEILLDRLGFTREGTSRQCWYSKGQYFDLINAAVLVNEWNQIRCRLLTELCPDIIVELGPRPSDDWCWPGRS
ncbi:GNAT family N-acetyltransferase [bacterium]|nr:GNAT family N-acetyltransferase [bacterium]MDC0434614.1 GNAT family N-acetyltransferase [bacterium]